MLGTGIVGNDGNTIAGNPGTGMVRFKLKPGIDGILGTGIDGSGGRAIAGNPGIGIKKLQLDITHS